MVSFFAGIEIVRFWPKTMDIVHGFDAISFRSRKSSLEGAI